MSLVVISRLFLLSLCLSLLVWAVYLLLLGKLSPKHKRSFKQVNDGMFVFLVSSFILDCKIALPLICIIKMLISVVLKTEDCTKESNS